MTSRYLLAVFDSVYVTRARGLAGEHLILFVRYRPDHFPSAGDGNRGQVRPRGFSPVLPLGSDFGGGRAAGVRRRAALLSRIPRAHGRGSGPRDHCRHPDHVVRGNSLTPAINQASDGGPADHERLERLHRRAVRLNVVVIVVGLLLLVGFATRPAPRTSGIIEMTPAERVRYDAAINRVIHDVEAKYGFRPARVPEPGETPVPDPLIDEGTVQEIESYYAQQASAGPGPRRPSPVRRAGASSRHGDSARTAAVPIPTAIGPGGRPWRSVSRLT